MKEIIAGIIGIILLLVFLFGGMFIKAHYEVKTFNKFSDEDATIIDALFADLRIEACRNN